MRKLVSKYYIVYLLLYLSVCLVGFSSFILAIPYLLLSGDIPLEIIKDMTKEFIRDIKYSYWKSNHKGQL